MTNTIKITIYNPKELWRMFCNWVFWPRRKKCAEYCDYYDVELMREVVDILQGETTNAFISDEAAERIEIAIRKASSEVAADTAKIMSKPFE